MKPSEYNPYITLQRYRNRFKQHEFKPVIRDNNIKEELTGTSGIRFRLGNESAIGIDVNLTNMPAFLGIAVESFGRAICDVIWMYSLETIGQDTILHGTFIHAFSNDRIATEAFVDQEIQRHAPTRRGVVMYHTADVAQKLQDQLRNFAGSSFYPTQKELPKGTTEELLVTIVKSDHGEVAHSAYIGTEEVPLVDEVYQV